MMFLEVVRIKC